MANVENLKKGKATQFKSGEQAAECGRKGGINSGKRKKEQKAYKELLSEMFKTKVNDEKLKAFAELYGVEDADVKTLTLLGMVHAAIGGNHKAFDMLLEMSGEKTQDKNADVLAKLDSVIGEVDKLAK